MTINSCNIKNCKIDEELFLIPSVSDWEKIIEGYLVDGLKVVGLESIPKRLNLVRKYPSVLLGIHKGKPLRGGWWYCALIELNSGEFQRVHLEEISCNSCDWKGFSANSTVYDLYYGSPNMELAHKNARELRGLKCPKCNENLPRHSIWVEPSE